MGKGGSLKEQTGLTSNNHLWYLRQRILESIVIVVPSTLALATLILPSVQITS